MKKILIACLLMLPCTAFAQEYRCDADGGVYYQSSRVIELPADQHKPYCSVFFDPRDKQQQQIVEWFNENQQLAELKHKTHFTAMPTTSKMFAARYSGTVDQLPCIRFQSADGETLCQMSGDRIPLSAEATASCINATLRRRRQHYQAPQPNLNYHLHYSVPDDKPDTKPDKQEDVFEPSPSMKNPTAIGVLIGAGVLALAGGVAWEWRKSYQS